MERVVGTDAGLTLTLQGNSRDVRTARSETRAFLATNPCAAPDEVLLVISELVTNAVLHGGGPVTVSVLPDPPDLIITVTDRGRGDPILHDADGEDELGRGLSIIHRLSTSCHVVRDVGCKTIVVVVGSTSGDLQ